MTRASAVLSDDQPSHPRVRPPHDEEHQHERGDLRHGARGRQPIRHGAREPGERHQEAALQPEPTCRRHPAVQTEPEHLAAQPDRSESGAADGPRGHRAQTQAGQSYTQRQTRKEIYIFLLY